jgi:hypothetical protein
MKMKNLRVKVLFPMLLLSAIALMPVEKIYAGIMVDPTVIEQSGRPGEVINGVYTVTNKSADPLVVNIQAVDWLERYLKQEGTLHPDEWLSFSEMSFTLDAAEVKKIPYTVTVPKDLKGEQAAQVYFEFNNPEAAQSMRTRLGVIFYLAPHDALSLQASIEDFIFDVSKKEDAGDSYSVAFRVRVKNLGDVHIRPFGKIRMQREGHDIVILQINPERGIYAGREEVLSAFVKDVPLLPGEYDVIAEIECGMYGKNNLIIEEKKITVE